MTTRLRCIAVMSGSPSQLWSTHEAEGAQVSCKGQVSPSPKVPLRATQLPDSARHGRPGPHRARAAALAALRELAPPNTGRTAATPHSPADDPPARRGPGREPEHG